MAISLTVIMPALNEAQNIEQAIKGVQAILPQMGISDYEILVASCPDKSGYHDGTADIVSRMGQDDPRIRSLHAPTFRRLGENYRNAVMSAQKEYIVMVPGDNENDPSSFVDMFREVGKADMVLTYTVNPEVRPWFRRVLSWTYTRSLNLLFGHRLKYYNGINIYRTEFLKQALPESDSFAYMAEIVLRQLKQKRSFIEVPIRVQARPGQSKALSWDNLKRVVRAIFRIWFQFHTGASKNILHNPSLEDIQRLLPPVLAARVLGHLGPEQFLSIQRVVFDGYAAFVTFGAWRGNSAYNRSIAFSRYPWVTRCLPVTKDGKVIMTEEARPIRGASCMMLPGGGGMDDSIRAVAVSEVKDETGSELSPDSRVILLSSIYPEDGLVDQKVELVVVDGLQAPSSYQNAREDIKKIFHIPFNEWQENALNGKYEDPWCVQFAARVSWDDTAQRVVVRGNFQVLT